MIDKMSVSMDMQIPGAGYSLSRAGTRIPATAQQKRTTEDGNSCGREPT